jgi:uncharacterized membrane protein
MTDGTVHGAPRPRAGAPDAFVARWLLDIERLKGLDRREWVGLAYWLPLAAVITAVELTGARATKWHVIPWTTISTATGHLETKWHWFALVVVSLIVLVVYLGRGYARRRKHELGRLKPVTLIAAKTKPAMEERVAPGEIGSPLYDLGVIVAAIAAGVLAHHFSDSKFVSAYWVYGTFIAFGIVLPSAYASVTKKETTLFGAIRTLEWILPWGSYALIAGMTVLAFHLAIYPWPNISHDSPDIRNGTTWEQAEAIALRQIQTPRKYYAVASRGAIGKDDAWIVTLYRQGGDNARCTYAVTSATSEPTLLGQRC